MTTAESRIMGWICLVMGYAFLYLSVPSLALIFLFSAFGFLLWTIHKDHDTFKGDPPGDA